MRRYEDEYGGGRLGGVWWSLWIIIAFVLFLIITMIFSQQFRDEILGDEWFIMAIVLGATILAFTPFFIIWRRELPICFNRNTRTVSYWIKGELAQVNWDEIVAYAKTKRSVTPGSGALIKEQLININIFTKGSGHYEPEEHDLGIAACDFSGSEDPVAEAKGLWEYIRKFMDEGKDALPETKVNTRICSLKESMIDTNPYPIKDVHIIGIIINTILLPFTVPFAILNVMTDMVYCVLDIILPKRKPPKALCEACEAEK